MKFFNPLKFLDKLFLFVYHAPRSLRVQIIPSFLFIHHKTLYVMYALITHEAPLHIFLFLLFPLSFMFMGYSPLLIILNHYHSILFP
jgi:hypothetical protein